MLPFIIYLIFSVILTAICDTIHNYDRIGSYNEFVDETMINGGIITYILNVSSIATNNFTIEHMNGLIRLYEIFINSSESQNYGTEYLSFSLTRSKYLYKNNNTFQLKTNNTLIEIFLQFRLFKNPPNNSDIHSFPIQITQYITVKNDKTNQYYVGQRLSTITKLYNYSSNELIFKKYNNNAIPQPIHNYYDLYDSLHNNECILSVVLYYGPPQYFNTIRAGSYSLYSDMYFDNVSPDDTIQLIADINQYLWYGPDLEVFDYGETNILKYPQIGINDYKFNGYVDALVTVIQTLDNSSNLHPGQVIENNLYYLRWNDTLFAYKIC